MRRRRLPALIPRKRLSYQFSGSNLEENMALHLRALGLIGVKREYQFHPTRKWRFDFALPEIKVAVECQGGIFTYGGHNRGAFMLKEYEKLNTAAEMGWRVLFAGTSKTLSGPGEVAGRVKKIYDSAQIGAVEAEHVVE